MVSVFIVHIKHSYWNANRPFHLWKQFCLKIYEHVSSFSVHIFFFCFSFLFFFFVGGGSFLKNLLFIDKIWLLLLLNRYLVLLPIPKCTVFQCFYFLLCIHNIILCIWRRPFLFIIFIHSSFFSSYFLFLVVFAHLMVECTVTMKG